MSKIFKLHHKFGLFVFLSDYCLKIDTVLLSNYVFFYLPSFCQADDPVLQKKTSKKLEKQKVPQRSEGQKKVALFSHLHQYERSTSITKNIG